MTAKSGLSRLGPLVLTVLIASCSPGGGECPQPTDRQERLPFTGIWQHQGGERALCLYQSAPDQVSGSFSGRPVTGRVASNGELFLAVNSRDQVEMYQGSLLKDTLSLESVVQSRNAGNPIIGLGKFVRQGFPQRGGS